MENIAQQLQEILLESKKINKWANIPTNEKGIVEFYQITKILQEIEKNKNETDIPVLMSKTDVAIDNAIKEYLLLTQKEKDEIQISGDIGWLLLGFGFNMATYALRLTDQEFFSHGLIALGIASNILDLREILKLLVLYWDVAKKVKLSFQPVLDISDSFSAILQRFIMRNEADKSLECMDFIIVGNGADIQYKARVN